MADTQYSKKDVYIIGASGLGREIASWNRTAVQSCYDILGFMDDNVDPLNEDRDSNLYQKVLKIDFSILSSDESIIMGISQPLIKQKFHTELIRSGISILPFIHPSVLIGERVTQGVGLVMCPNSLLSCDVTVGDLVFINCGSQIGHDVIVGNYTSIMANVDIGGGAVIGKNVFIGSGATILPGVHIPDNTVIGAGAVVIRSIKITGGTYFGNPASRIL